MASTPVPPPTGGTAPQQPPAGYPNYPQYAQPQYPTPRPAGQIAGGISLWAMVLIGLGILCLLIAIVILAAAEYGKPLALGAGVFQPLGQWSLVAGLVLAGWETAKKKKG